MRKRAIYVGIREDGEAEVKALPSAIHERWIWAIGPFKTNTEAIAWAYNWNARIRIREGQV